MAFLLGVGAGRTWDSGGGITLQWRSILLRRRSILLQR
jgi:hypothetical protein